MLLLRVHLLVYLLTAPLPRIMITGSGNPEKLCWEPQSVRRSCCCRTECWLESSWVRTLHTKQMRHVSQRSCLSELSRSVAVSARNYRLVSKSYLFFSKRMVRFFFLRIRASSCTHQKKTPPFPLPYMGGEDGRPCTGYTWRLANQDVPSSRSLGWVIFDDTFLMSRGLWNDRSG